MKHMKHILRLLAGVALILGMTAPFTLASNATTLPVLYNYASGWSNPTVEPQWILVGQGGAPAAHTWHWNTWNSTGATSTGTLWVNNCAPTCASGKTSYHKLYVTMYWVKTHNGQKYFYGMKWYTPGYRLFGERTSTSWWHFNGHWDVVA